MAFPHKLVRFFVPFLLFIAACAPGGQYLISPYTPPRRVAVLPMDNHTTDLNGPDIVRYWMNDRLANKKGYDTLPLGPMDEALEAKGIREGGQLPSLSSQQLGELLGAEALIYGDLLDFTYQTTGFLNVRKVKAHFRMVEARTGKLLWEAEGLGANSEGGITGAAALQAGLKALGTQAAEKALSSPLRTETWDMIWNAIEYLPRAQ